MTQFSDISITVQDSIVTLRGHVPTISDKLQVENAMKSAAGGLGVENRLVSDYDLTIQVAQSLGRDGRTRLAMISVNTRNGFVTLSGHVGSSAAQWEAEEIAARIPGVRGLINNIQAPCTFLDPAEDRLLQPPIGQKVYAADILLGMVDKVIIDPHNRRVSAFIVNGNFPDPKIHDSTQSLSEDTFQERRVVLPSRIIRYETDTTVFLDIDGMEAAEYGDYNQAQYIPPPDEWQPPYPYRNQDVLFEGLTKELLGDWHELVERAINVEQKACTAEQESNDKVEVSIQESQVEAIARREIFKAKIMQRQADETEAHVESAIGLTMRAIDEVEIAMFEAIETVDCSESITEPVMAQNLGKRFESEADLFERVQEATINRADVRTLTCAIPKNSTKEESTVWKREGKSVT